MSDEEYLLGGATRGDKLQPRGFIESWNPYRTSREFLAKIDAILIEYAKYLPLTIRQVFYRLVGAHGYNKSEAGYDTIMNLLNTARRAGRIEWSALRDDGGQFDIDAYGYADADAFLDQIRYQADRFRLDRQEGQESRLVIACEAEGMIPQLERVARPFGVPVISGGGFNSTTKRYDLAVALSEIDAQVEFLHIGDHDWHGVHIYLALKEDVTAFVDELGGEVSFERLAVVPDQIRDLRLPRRSRRRARRSTRRSTRLSATHARRRQSRRTCWPTSCAARSSPD